MQHSWCVIASLNAVAQEPTVPLKHYQRTLLKAKAYRAQAVQLQAQLRKMTARVSKLTKVCRVGISAGRQ